MDEYLSINDIRVPRFLYGTAWKEDDTERLTRLAVQNGFRGIDTANQRKHYHEAAVGQGIVAAIRAGLVKREDLFLQTKFTFRGGQDHRLPYDPAAPIGRQVEQSFAQSLTHLGVDTIDSYVLHGPSSGRELQAADWEAWRAMEAILASGRVKLLGASNMSAEQVQALCAKAKVKPSFVQNRCYASRGWDREVRTLCTANGVVYQGFSLLTANRGALGHPEVQRMARRRQCEASQILFRFALDAGMIALTGTTDAEHMRADLAVLHFELDPEERRTIERIAG